MTPRMWLYGSVVLVVMVGLSILGNAIYSAGKNSVLTRLRDERVTILRDGAKIDEKVFSADDDALYCMLVECVQDDGRDKPL